MSVSRVTDRAGVSRRTFYNLFEDREDCFLAMFEDAVRRVESLVTEAYASGAGWREKTRSALAALLWFLDDEPGVGSLLIVDALQAGPKVLRRRTEIMARLSGFLQRETTESTGGPALPALTGEGVVGAVIGVIQTRLLQGTRDSMLDLLNPLMAMVTLPYLGATAAHDELEVSSSGAGRMPAKPASGPQGDDDPLARLPMRITYRTLRVLNAVGGNPGASNREVADWAEVSDQGQMSRLLARLERLELVRNTGQRQPSGEPNAWRLTAKGEEIYLAIRAQSSVAERQSNGMREPHADVDRH
jgi:AcrR family transcriptional regulator/DNA-binding MarR family transcriptional regulator